jgi:sugar lactone lactonase YvrE
MGFMRKMMAFSAALVAFVAVPSATGAAAQSRGDPDKSRLVAGLQGSVGSTVGPDGALYVPESAAGRITRIDPRTGATSTFTSGLPRMIPAAGFGGAVDVAFLGRTAYVLVTLVDAAYGGTDVDGIYRVDGGNRFTVVADIGEFAFRNPPDTPFFDLRGVQYAMEPYRGGFLVTDGHHNRVYRVTLDGRVRELITFGNIVPTGLAVRGGTIYMAEAGPVPHRPEDGKVVRFGPRSTTAREVASGAPLLVDVEFSRGHRLFALSQGVWAGDPEGFPAAPNTGAIVRVNRDGDFTAVVEGLNQPTSLEFIRNAAYVVTLTGEVWRINAHARDGVQFS